MDLAAELIWHDLTRSQLLPLEEDQLLRDQTQLPIRAFLSLSPHIVMQLIRMIILRLHLMVLQCMVNMERLQVSLLVHNITHRICNQVMQVNKVLRRTVRLHRVHLMPLRQYRSLGLGLDKFPLLPRVRLLRSQAVKWHTADQVQRMVLVWDLNILVDLLSRRGHQEVMYSSRKLMEDILAVIKAMVVVRRRGSHRQVLLILHHHLRLGCLLDRICLLVE